MTPVLATHALMVGYARPRAADVVIAKQLNVVLKQGELTCLIGPNGAGKTTLLRTLAGMVPPLAGRVALMGDDVHRLPARTLARRVSVVLTERVMVEGMTGYQLVATGRHPYTDWTGRFTAHDSAVIQWAVEAVGAEALAPRPIVELSDGERQKLLIARTLAQDTPVILLDEPTAFLDLPRRVELLRLLRALARETQRAILLSTHDLDLALRSADGLWLMAGNGRVQVGAPEDLVLDGALAHAFAQDGITFEEGEGAFRLQPDTHGVVALVGDGMAAAWTRRALTRAGFAVQPTAPTTIYVNEGDSPTWRVMRGERAREVGTVYELVGMLNDNGV